MTANRWRYAGKEEFPEVEMLDFGARFYDPFTTRWITDDPLAHKYPSMSPYLYCANNPVNRVDPDGLTDWRAVGKGAITMLGGIGTTVGGVALATGTGGAATPLSAYLVIEGGSEVIFGFGILLAGFASDNSEDQSVLIDSIPTGLTNTIAKTVDVLTGDENHTIERIADAAQTVVTAGTSLQSDISLVTKSLVRMSNAISITKSSSFVTQDTSSNQDKKDSSERKNSNMTSYPSYDESGRDEFYLWKNEQQSSTLF